jgi:hypothetical protein
MVRLCLIVVCAAIALPTLAWSQGDFKVAESDIPAMKFNHYYGPDKKHREPDFEWSFANETFVLKKRKSAIPDDLQAVFLEKAATADEITGKWSFKDGKITFSDIKAGKQEAKKEASIGVYKTAPTVVRIGDVPQYVFAVAR